MNIFNKVTDKNGNIFYKNISKSLATLEDLQECYEKACKYADKVRVKIILAVILSLLSCLTKIALIALIISRL